MHPGLGSDEEVIKEFVAANAEINNGLNPKDCI
jgi:hypothetical protein